MEWVLVPLIIIAITVIIGFLASATTDWLHILTVILAFISLCFCVGAPISYYDSLNNSLRYAAYYDSIIVPNIINETTDSVDVSSSTVSTWELANRPQLIAYNSYLATNKYWDNIPIIGWMVYTAPSNLKYVHIINKL